MTGRARRDVDLDRGVLGREEGEEGRAEECAVVAISF